ncbi:MAG: HlyD family efflux transporter periplasmic adaptor subunit [Myxococcales bacterium FL481]|nr:MAG: HlyD family efflux transporter periplasmic adaptor subunit [Myxococcales bacterium FL481]
MTSRPSISLAGTTGQDISRPRPDSRWRRWVFVAAAILGLAGAAAVALPALRSLLDTDMVVSRRGLRLAVVERGEMSSNIAVQGRVVAANSPTLHAPAAGLVNLHVDPGDSVEAGTLLAVIDNPELASRLAQEEATLEQLELEVGRQRLVIERAALDQAQILELAQLDVDLARKRFDGTQSLRSHNLLSRLDYDSDAGQLHRSEVALAHAKRKLGLDDSVLKLELEAKRSQLARQRHLVADFKRQVDALRIHSPSHGRVGTVSVRPMDTVMRYSPLLTIIDLSAQEIEVEIPESYADDVAAGLNARIEFDGPTYGGQLVAVSPEVNTGRVIGRVRFTDERPPELRQNQRVTVRIHIETRSDVIKVQRGAFVESGGARLAYVVRDATAQRRRIQLGARGIDEVEIISGLDPGETVIVSTIEDYVDSNRLHLTP